MQQKFYSNGKLLLSGEYAILDGALGLAIPTKYGQSLEVSPTNSGILEWKSFDSDNSIWFEAQFSIPELKLISSKDKNTANRLKEIFMAVRETNGEFLLYEEGIMVETYLDFPRKWGLGTSSTLVNNIAQWAMVNAHDLLQCTFGGSGYDIACAQHDQPILYQLKNKTPVVQEIDFRPLFLDTLFFVYLNEKRNSREAISNYRNLKFDKSELAARLSEITKKIETSSNLSEFELLITQHEGTLSKVLGIPPVKSRLFPDYPGAIKSLGAWGGDFVLVTGNKESEDYFTQKGYNTVIPFFKMIL